MSQEPSEMTAEVLVSEEGEPERWEPIPRLVKLDRYPFNLYPEDMSFRGFNVKK